MKRLPVLLLLVVVVGCAVPVHRSVHGLASYDYYESPPIVVTPPALSYYGRWRSPGWHSPEWYPYKGGCYGGYHRHHPPVPEPTVEDLRALRKQAVEDYTNGKGIPYVVFNTMSPAARRAYGVVWDAAEDAAKKTGIYYERSRRRLGVAEKK